jgi:hypothetical protein
MTLRVLGPLYGSKREFCRGVAGDIKRGGPLAGSVIAAVVAMISLVPVPAAGQASAPTRWSPPRLADGQPDMQGHWISDAVGAAHSVEDGRDPADDVIQARVGERNPIVVVDPPDRRIPYQSAAAARRAQLLRDIFTPTQPEHVDPHVRAFLDGVPRNNYVPGGMEFIQRPGYVSIVYESNHSYRVIPLDGQPHVGQQVKLWMGDSRGRWEGNTLVVDVTNFTDRTWIDSHGSFHSDALHVVERWTLVSADRIDYEATLEDPKVLTRPWKMAFQVNRNKQAGYEIFEDTRHEGERDVEQIILGGKHAKDAGLTGIHEHRREGR